MINVHSYQFVHQLLALEAKHCESIELKLRGKVQ